MTRAERVAAAKERLLSRYPDRDEQEAKRMESFRGLTKEQLDERFRQAAEERGIKVANEMQQHEEALTH